VLHAQLVLNGILQLLEFELGFKSSVEQGFVILRFVISRAVAIMSASLNLRYLWLAI
jgi:hypothetical protein